MSYVSNVFLPSLIMAPFIFYLISTLFNSLKILKSESKLMKVKFCKKMLMKW
uniref:ATP synthase F0 subunit 8 n=1 Tax=Nymphon unguiculatum-charcoti complex sp. SEM-1997 TaxID=61899 RepID=E0XLG9_9CHEL|nr:ATP synthase F0 subunit 8 [Nymphon unguiculatum-charcoti complex sp. SEM-1997]